MAILVNIEDSNVCDLIVKTLLANKLVIMPCDTIYGIIGLAPSTKYKLENLKGRNQDKKFIEFVTKELAQIISKTEIDQKVLDLWPAPLTVIVNDHLGQSRGIRVPDDPLILKILEKVDKSIYTTSVNISGDQFINDFDKIVDVFCDKVDLIVEGKVAQNKKPSTIVDLTQNPYKVLREGEVDFSSI